MDLRSSSDLDENYGSQYGNIGGLLLSWISVRVPSWIIVKTIISPFRRLDSVYMVNLAKKCDVVLNVGPSIFHPSHLYWNYGPTAGVYGLDTMARNSLRLCQPFCSV